MKKLTTVVVLTALLLTPTLPARADGGPALGWLAWLAWLQGWVETTMSRVTGEAGPKIDPWGNRLEGEAEGNDEGPTIDPWGLTDDSGTDDGDVGAGIDPAG